MTKDTGCGEFSHNSEEEELEENCFDKDSEMVLDERKIIESKKKYSSKYVNRNQESLPSNY